MARDTAVLEECRALVAAHAPPRDARIPLLVRFTHEDKAAKGLRKFQDPDAKRQPPVHFTPLEIVQMERLVLLTGPRGSGKTTFARDLAAHLAGEILGDRKLNIAALTRDVPRNDEGHVEPERWTLGPIAPLLRTTPRGCAALPVLIRGGASEFMFRHPSSNEEGSPAPQAQAGVVSHRAPTLLIIDAIEQAGAHGPQLLRDLAGFAAEHAELRILVLGDATIYRSWPVPTAFKTHALMPLLRAQRGETPTLDTTGFVTLARTLNVRGDCDAVVDAWSARNPSTTPDFLVPHLDARRLTREQLLAAFTRDPIATSDTIRLAAPRHGDALLRALVDAPGEPGLIGAVLAASILGTAANATLAAAIDARLLDIVAHGRLPLALREEAGRQLATRGDPRDLLALCDVPGGRFTMGSALHPNSSPAHEVTVAPFRIGRFPITNAIYKRFIAETGRPWRSADGLLPERASAPAVDLTWRDADAFCAWLTARWHEEGRIARDARVRLPTEPEWERAARGDQPDSTSIVYPWRGGWAEDRANGEEAGLNDTCTVGLFPQGASPYGCLDMAGQVWEWCTTLWGEDMATPSFRYPYRDDGREDRDAGPRIRRVLRGGCFSSGREKACCTYRGSLEPDGFWRGNGFRIVVARDVT